MIYIIGDPPAFNRRRGKKVYVDRRINTKCSQDNQSVHDKKKSLNLEDKKKKEKKKKREKYT